jgi:hypothetical protein
MQSSSTFLYWLIISCEVAFWLVLALGLVARYMVQHERLSRMLLLSLPLIDLLLLVFTAADLKAGTPAAFAHGLATAYVGFTVAFGSLAVEWADQHFAHRFAGGPPPASAPDAGWAAVRYDLNLWFRCILAWIIALVLVIALIAYVGDEASTQPLHAWFRYALGSTFLWFIFGPAWSLVFFRRAES